MNYSITAARTDQGETITITFPTTADHDFLLGELATSTEQPIWMFVHAWIDARNYLNDPFELNESVRVDFYPDHHFTILALRDSMAWIYNPTMGHLLVPYRDLVKVN